ncbi:MAG: hypothetical protein ILP18_02685, partial [Treponema sp.]|nr:hypothetical protein [Treponema sp.]
MAEGSGGFTGTKTEGNGYDRSGRLTDCQRGDRKIHYSYSEDGRECQTSQNSWEESYRYDADGNLIKECSSTRKAVYAYNAANRMAESHITEIRDGSCLTPKDIDHLITEET